LQIFTWFLSSGNSTWQYFIKFKVMI
jgi:hypothetical protein